MSVLPVGFSGSGDYTIEESLRFNASQSSYLNKTFTTPTNNKIWTFSCWFKRGQLTYGASGASGALFFAPSSGSTFAGIYFTPTDIINWYDANTGTVYILQTTQVFRDTSAWYHLVCAYDSTQATDTNRLKMYVNGVQITAFSTAIYPAQNTNGRLNSAVSHVLGQMTVGPQYFDGYMAEVNFIDGQALTPSSFGEFDNTTGVWKPRQYVGTYGTNGFYLDFSDATSATTLGYDYSGNANNWTLNSFNTTPTNVLYCSMTDTPTPYLGGGNYCTVNPLSRATTNTYNFTNGNLDVEIFDASNTQIQTRMTMGVSSGKWYWEATLVSYATYQPSLGVAADNVLSSSYVGTTALQWGVYGPTGEKMNGGTSTAYGSAAAVNDVVQIALDMDNGKIWFGKNGTWFASGAPASGTNAAFTNLAGNTVLPAMGVGGTTNAGGKYAFNFGQRPFAYTPPTGFKALHTGNLPDSTIKDGSQYFNTVTYSGTGASLSIPVGFIPDFTWIKRRNAANNNQAFDVLRNSNVLVTNETGAESDYSAYFDFSDSDGFDLPAASVNMNNASGTYVAWNWKANGAGVSNTAGTITSTVSANTTAGFSIVAYTGTGANATVGHGLGAAPSMVLVKGRSFGSNWNAYHSNLTSASYYIRLNTTAAQENAQNFWNSTAPTSTVFSLSSETDVNSSGNTFVAYCFAPVAGYSAFGSYTGNGSADGPFVYLGFRPKWVLIKETTVSSRDWIILDTSRNTYNVADLQLLPNTAEAESTTFFGSTAYLDILSNGFKVRNTSVRNNENTAIYIYAAFAENPFKNSLAR